MVAKGPVLDQSHIGRHNRSLLDQELRRVSWSAGSVVGEGRGVEVLLDPLALATISNVEWLTRNQVGAILTHIESGVIVAFAAIYCKRRARLRRIQSGDLPSAKQVSKSCGRIFEFRKIVD